MGGPRSPAWEDGPVAWTVTCFSGASGVPLQAWKAGQHGLRASAALCLFGGRGPAPLSLTAERVRAQAFPSVLTGTRLLCSDTPQRGSVPSVGRGRRERCTRGFPGLYPVGPSLADFHLRPRDRKPRLGGGACRALSILWVGLFTSIRTSPERGLRCSVQGVPASTWRAKAADCSVCVSSF